MKKLVVLSGAFVLFIGCKKKEEAKPDPTPLPDPKLTEKQPDPPPPPPGPDPKVLARGEYLVKAGACLVCHTAMGPGGPDLANMGAGGLEMKEKFGVWRTSNITPDKGTGIGNWTDDQIVVAIREGLRPDGSQLIPMMPYMNYNGLTDDDAKAIVTFLRTLKPVERVVQKSLVKLTPVAAPKAANKTPTPGEQGMYMASVMLCNHCHMTPNKDFTGPAGMDKLFSGGLPMEMPPLGTGTLYPANLTSDPETGLGKWTEEQIYTAIKTMQKPDGKLIQGPMLFMQASWSQLEDADIRAVAGFIKKLPPVTNKVPKSTFKPHTGPPPGAPSAAAGSAGGAPPPGDTGHAPPAKDEKKSK